jgi:hypothetical protein
MAKISVAEYAASRKKRGLPGGTVQAVWKAGDSGRITITDGQVDPDTADFEWDKNTRRRIDLHGVAPSVPQEAATQPERTEGARKWDDSKAREQAAKAELMEIDLAARKGTLIDRAGYERAALHTHRMLRDALVDVLPAKLAPELAGLGSDIWSIECRLRESIRETLTAVAGAWKAEAESEAG